MADVVRTPRQLSQVLRAYRKLRGVTQKQAGDRVGLLPKTISALEQHPEGSSMGSLFRLLSALDLELAVQEKATPGRADTPEW